MLSFIDIYKGFYMVLLNMHFHHVKLLQKWMVILLARIHHWMILNGGPSMINRCIGYCITLGHYLLGPEPVCTPFLVHVILRLLWCMSIVDRTHSFGHIEFDSKLWMIVHAKDAILGRPVRINPLTTSGGDGKSKNFVNRKSWSESLIYPSSSCFFLVIETPFRLANNHFPVTTCPFAYRVQSSAGSSPPNRHRRRLSWWHPHPLAGDCRLYKMVAKLLWPHISSMWP